MNVRNVAIAALALVLVACSSTAERPLLPDNPLNPEANARRAERLKAAELYKLGRQALDSSDFTKAMEHYKQLTTRYPFTDYAVQAQIENVYCLYRSYQPDEALTAAEHFLRDYPRHKSAAYVQYLKGLINFDRNQTLSESLGFDTVKRDTSNLRRAFDDFALLIQRYPDSAYVADARARMIYLRNRIARHELSIVQFYVRRGAYIAAAKRAESIVSQYPGAPATIDALALLEQSYTALGLDDQARDAHTLYKAYLAAAPAAGDNSDAPDSDQPTLELPPADAGDTSDKASG